MDTKGIVMMLNDPWEIVKRARDMNRISTVEIIESLLSDFIELHGDALYADDSSIIGGIGLLNDIPVTIIATRKGKTISDRADNNYGMPHPEGYRKSIRLMKQAEKYKRPVITIIDTPGAYPGVEAEKRGQAVAIAKSLFEMSGLEVPIINIVLGEGGSGGALAIGVADKIYMFENAIYSVISPEGFATILFNDSKLAPKITKHIKLTSRDLLNYNIVDEIIYEKELNTDYGSFIEKLKSKILLDICDLEKYSSKELLIKRYSKFRKIGTYFEE